MPKWYYCKKNNKFGQRQKYLKLFKADDKADCDDGTDEPKKPGECNCNQVS